MDKGFYKEHGWVLIPGVIPKEYIRIAKEKGIPLVKWSQENIYKPQNIESTALGACIVSQISEGIKINDIKSKIEEKYQPRKSLQEFFDSDYEVWRNYICLLYTSPSPRD